MRYDDPRSFLALNKTAGEALIQRHRSQVVVEKIQRLSDPFVHGDVMVCFVDFLNLGSGRRTEKIEHRLSVGLERVVQRCC